MHTGHASFDASRFAKLHAFATSIPSGHDNANERDVARRKAEKVAADAGLTFDQAESLIRVHSRSSASAAREKSDQAKADAWAEHVRQHERRQRDQREQAEQARRDRQREQEAREAKARRDAERREAEASIWRRSSPESLIERALALAARNLGLNPYAPIRDVTAAVESAARHAYPFPSSFAEAISEFEALEVAEKKRRRPVPKYRHGGLISLRNDLIVDFLASRSRTPEDAIARAEWVRIRGHDLPGPDLSEWMRLIADDVVRIAKSLDTAKTKLAAQREHREYRAARPSKPIKMTTAQKRQAVKDILDGPGADKLTLREIAERAGVHHSTVASIKRERQAGN